MLRDFKHVLRLLPYCGMVKLLYSLRLLLHWFILWSDFVWSTTEAPLTRKSVHSSLPVDLLIHFVQWLHRAFTVSWFLSYSWHDALPCLAEIRGIDAVSHLRVIFAPVFLQLVKKPSWNSANLTALRNKQISSLHLYLCLPFISCSFFAKNSCLTESSAVRDFVVWPIWKEEKPRMVIANITQIRVPNIDWVRAQPRLIPLKGFPLSFHRFWCTFPSSRVQP